MTGMRVLTKIFDGTNKFLAVLAGILIVFMMLSVSTEVVMRYFFNRPSVWVVEISEISLLYITFLGTAWLLTNDKHIKMDLLLTRLNQKSQAILNLSTSILGVISCFLVTWYSGLTFWDHFQRGLFKPTFLDIPDAPVLIIIPLGSLLLSIQFLRRVYNYWGLMRSEDK